VGEQVLVQGRLGDAGQLAVVAGVLLLPGVQLLVDRHGGTRREGREADHALKRLLVGVDLDVQVQLGDGAEGTTAKLTHVEAGLVAMLCTV
jgi:hypothetical protein